MLMKAHSRTLAYQISQHKANVSGGPSFEVNSRGQTLYTCGRCHLQDQESGCDRMVNEHVGSKSSERPGERRRVDYMSSASMAGLL